MDYYTSFSDKCKSVQWGSLRPLNQVCKPSNIQMKGIPCTNIWNNNTKRKIIVNNNYKYK